MKKAPEKRKRDSLDVMIYAYVTLEINSDDIVEKCEKKIRELLKRNMMIELFGCSYFDVLNVTNFSDHGVPREERLCGPFDTR